MARSRFTTCDGATLAYRDEGEGLPVIALAGMTRDGRDFDYMAHHLHGVRLIRLDSRGRGESDWTGPATYTVTQEAADVLALMDHLGLKSAAIIGTSRGGLLGMVLAATAPGRVLGLCLNDVGPVLERSGLERIGKYIGVEPSVPTLQDVIERLPAASPGFANVPEMRWAEETIRRYVQKEGAVGLTYDPALREAFDAGLAQPAADAWPLFDACAGLPLCLIHGANSDVLSLATAEEMARRRPDMIRAELPDRGHVPFLDEPQALAAIRSWLDAVARAAPANTTAAQGWNAPAPCPAPWLDGFARAIGAERRIDTHISHVFLTPDRAFKIKRAVRLPYVDFSTLAAREAACRAELALNAGAAPGLYLAVHRITAGPGEPELDGPGETLDWAVEMARFDDDALLLSVLREGRLTRPLLEEVAAAIAAAHLAAAPRDAQGAANIAAVLTINEAGFATSAVLPPDKVAALNAACRAALDRAAPALDARAAAGHVRRCHGDLHLRNICIWQGKPRLFDCIDFNEDLAVSDTLYDLAFLLMDLWQAELGAQANLLANRYMDLTGDEGGWPLLPLFMAIRASVRAHVTATQAESARGTDCFAPLAKEAGRYLDLALMLLEPAAPRLVVLGGLSGSGKTTLSEALAPHLSPPPGARLIETDRTRKALFGATAETALPPGAYAETVSARVYDTMAARAGALLAAGAPVVANGVFRDPAHRAALRAAASANAARFDGFWLTAPPEALRTRVAARPKGASDATVAVLDAQLSGVEPPLPDGWRVLSSAGDPEATLAAARAALD